MPIKGCRELIGCETGPVSLAVNGRVGRRVACVLDNRRTTMQTLDLEGDGDDMEAEPGDELPDVGRS
jgi:anaphase-promoting complex subunit 4